MFVERLNSKQNRICSARIVWKCAAKSEVFTSLPQLGCRRPPLPLLPASRCGPGGHRWRWSWWRSQNRGRMTPVRWTPGGCDAAGAEAGRGPWGRRGTPPRWTPGRSDAATARWGWLLVLLSCWCRPVTCKADCWLCWLFAKLTCCYRCHWLYLPWCRPLSAIRLGAPALPSRHPPAVSAGGGGGGSVWRRDLFPLLAPPISLPPSVMPKHALQRGSLREGRRIWYGLLWRPLSAAAGADLWPTPASGPDTNFGLFIIECLCCMYVSFTMTQYPWWRY